MLESTIVSVVRFSNAVESGGTVEAQERAAALLDQLAELAETGGVEEGFTLALVEKAGFLLGCVQAVSRGEDGGWIAAFEKGCAEALALSNAGLTASGFA